MDTATLTDSQAATLQRYRDNLLSGETLRLKAASVGSVRGDWVIVGRQAFAHALQTLGRMAADSDAMAQVAGAVVRDLTKTQVLLYPRSGGSVPGTIRPSR